jgi:hypothetical protein
MDISKVKLVDFFKPKKIKAFLRYLASKYLFDDRNLIEMSFIKNLVSQKLFIK